MPLLGSVLTSLLLAVTLVLAAAVAGVMAYHYAKARLRERRGFTYDPEADEATPAAGAVDRAKSAEEIAQIRARIEALMEQQHVRSETQGQHLAQKLDEIRSHMNTQDRKMDGLKSELRHEIRRRDGELDELRHQLASALDAFWKSMPAFPSVGGALALPLAPPTPAPEPVEPARPAASEAHAEEPAPLAYEAAPEAHAGAPEPLLVASAEPEDVEAAPVAPPPWTTSPIWRAPEPPAAPAAPPRDAPAVRPSVFEEVPIPSVPPPVAPPSVPAPHAAPPPVVAAPAVADPFAQAAPPEEAPARPLFVPMDAAFEAAPASPPPAPAAIPPPVAQAAMPPAMPPAALAPVPALKGDDLTIISGVTEELQQRLYAAGVTTLDEMARWSRADARRISGLVGVSEAVIMHQWIFEAQSALFEHYQQQMTQQA